MVTFQFRVFERRRQADDFAVGIDFLGELAALFRGKPEQLFEHADHIVVGVIVVIPQDDIVPRLAPRFLAPV